MQLALIAHTVLLKVEPSQLESRVVCKHRVSIEALKSVFVKLPSVLVRVSNAQHATYFPNKSSNLVWFLTSSCHLN